MNEVLFHYCPTHSFHSIVANEAIRLTSLSLSNDSMEGQLAHELLLKRADKLDLTATQKEDLKIILRTFDENVYGLGFCLSSKKDQLSQWRGYADDAQGFSIGFEKSKLINALKKTHDFIDLVLIDIHYQPHEHIQLIDETLNLIKEYLFKKANNTQDHRARFAEVSDVFSQIVKTLYKIKGVAFAEESESRLFSNFAVGDGDGGISFYPTKGTLMPYRTFNLEVLAKESITQVILGPKNRTPIKLIERFLSDHKFHNVEVKKSIATYR